MMRQYRVRVQGRIKQLIKELESALKREDGLRRELVGHREKAHGNYWAWQGDGEDHLESLVTHCPVLIQAKDLQAIIQERDEAQAKCRELEDRLAPIDPGGGDKLDELEASNNFLRDRAERAEAKCAEMRESLGVYSPWPITDILHKLANWCDHLNHVHDCDCDGHETCLEAVKRARTMIEQINHALSSDCGKGYVGATEK